MIKFIREDQLAKEFKALAEPRTGILIAAPFWGAGATKLLALAKRRRVRIICNFYALGCNPAEIAELHRIGVKVRSNTRLHAKIYAAGDFVILGSSNPSRFGVTQEGDTLGGSIEANILTDHSATVGAAKKLLEALWEDDQTFTVTPRMVQEEIARRALLPKPFVRRGLQAKTLLAACREAPELFDSVYVAHYWTDLGQGGKVRLREFQREAAQANAAAKSWVFRNAWGYQFEAPPPSGAWLIALDCKRPEKPKVWGASQVPNPFVALAVAGEDDLYPTVRGVVTVPGAAGAFRIADSEKAQLAALAPRLKRRDDLVPLSEAVAMIDRARRS